MTTKSTGEEFADQLRREQTCRVEGHSFDIIIHVGTGNPVVVACGHCGKSWKVQK